MFEKRVYVNEGNVDVLKSLFDHYNIKYWFGRERHKNSKGKDVFVPYFTITGQDKEAIKEIIEDL